MIWISQFMIFFALLVSHFFVEYFFNIPNACSGILITSLFFLPGTFVTFFKIIKAAKLANDFKIEIEPEFILFDPKEKTCQTGKLSKKSVWWIIFFDSLLKN